MLRVRVLGGLAIEDGGRPLPVPASRPARELLAWLALHPGAHPRLELAMRFWPDVLETSARASLRTTLHELRREIGAEHLVVDRETVGLAPAWVDALEVERLAPGEALALCTGEPLVGIERDWAIAFRDEHRERVAALVAGLADAAADPPSALRWARELARLDPLSEDATRRLMRAHADAGDRAAAVAAYTRLADRLRRDLSIPPSRQTRELLAEIRAGEGDEPPLGGGDQRGAAARRDERSVSARPPFPPALAGRGGAFAGRAAELRAVSDALRPGRRGVLLLAGEPGIGKTRLLAEAGRAAHADGATVLYGRCHEERLTPYEPFVEALAALAGAPLAVDVGAAELARLVPPLARSLGPAPAPPAAEGERWRLFEAVAAALPPPVVLLLDDLHWADAGTLRLLSHLLRRAHPPVVAGAYRDTDVSRRHPLAAALADLRRDGLVERLAVGGLDEAAVAELVAGEHGPPGLAGPLQRETGGNPFFVEEVLRHLEGAAEPGRLPIPEGVKDVIGRRLSRLAPDTGRTLAVAAVAGREFDVTLLEALLPEVDVLGALEEAAAAQMVREAPGVPGRFAFAHALVRETLYDELSLTRRVRTHRALADALATRPAPRLAELAHHRLEAAAAGDAAEAADAALAAAREALAALAYEEAASFCERGLTALEDAEPRRRAELQLALGDARLRAGDRDGARAAFAAAAGLARGEMAREGGAAELLARAALGFSGLGVTIIAVDADAVALLEEALAALPDDHPLGARLVARLAIETYYASTPQRRKALGDRAVDLARKNDATSLLDALNARHAALWSAAYLDERLTTAGEMIALAREVGDAERELQGRNWRVTDLLERGDLAEARREIAAHEALAERLKLPAYRWWGPMWRSSLAILEGRFADAEALIATIGGDPNADLYAEIQRYGLDWARERFELFDEEAIDRESGRPAEYAYRSGFAWILCLNGREDEARRQVEWVTADDFARFKDDMNSLAALTELTQALVLLDEPGPAAGVLERLAPYADRNVVNGRGASGYGSAAHHVAALTALLGRHEEAGPRFEAALRHNAALGSRPWVARTQERYAASLHARGEHDRARELARAAAATARELGIAPLAERAQRLA